MPFVVTEETAVTADGVPSSRMTIAIPIMRAFLLFAICAGTFAFASSKQGQGPGTAAISQFFIDPTLPDQGWIVTANAVQFNGGIKSGGKWAIKFDREIFEKVASEKALPGFKILRLQPTQVRRGAVLLLVDNAPDPKETPESFSRYVFLSLDGGEKWKVSRKATMPVRVVAETKPPPPTATAAPMTPGGEPDSAGAKLAPAQTPMKVQMDRERAASGPPTGGVNSQEERMLEAAGHHPAGVSPLFNLFFDLWLNVRPGVSPLSFDTYHTLVLLDLHASRELQFSAELSPTPRYYEITYRATPRLEFRGGRIWIPFDEMNPHELYGGFYNIQRLRQPGSLNFLPEIWTDLGVATKYTVYKSPKTQIDAHAYVVNGFADGARDPLNQVGTRYPEFGGSSTTDNNSDKAIGLRLHGSYNRWFGLGASVYEGRYTDDGDVDRRILMYGVDLQLNFGATKMKSGYILMNVDLPGTNRRFERNGFYLELQQRFTERLRLIARGGSETDDSRIVTVGNRTLLGGELVYSYGNFQFSLFHYKDLYQIRGKANYEMSGLRATAMF